MIWQEFKIQIMFAEKVAAKIIFEISSHTNIGEIQYKSTVPELRAFLKTLSRRTWEWDELIRNLIDNLTLATGGRYIVRLGATPVKDGRNDTVLQDCMRRVNG